jgi:hypothetical protein
MEAAGTLQDVRAFSGLLQDVRERAEWRVVFWVTHHENARGQVSGAWAGNCDLLLHVTAQGHGRTRLYFQKVRWASDFQKKTLQLVWTDNEGFDIDEKPEADDEMIGELILAAIAADPGIGWTRVEEQTKGVNAARRRAIRDGLFARREIINVTREGGTEVGLFECPKGKVARLYLAADPAVQHLVSELRPAPDAVGTQSGFTASGTADAADLASASAEVERLADLARRYEEEQT